ncbi:MAG: MFS transporter [Gammaproteobacteria bacterium]|nr:MFS transporter [Gammaproteobacteria bacterium]
MDRATRRRLFWVAVLYIAEGLPFGLFTDVFPVAFREQHASLDQIGIISLLGLPWTLKFLWAPAVDHFRHHRLWMLGADLLMALALGELAFVAGIGHSALIAIGCFTMLSSTNDIAIDGYTLELLKVGEMGVGNGLRIGFYRAGMLMAGLVLIASSYVGWRIAYVLAAALLVIDGIACLRAPREAHRTHPGEQSVGAELRSLMHRPRALALVLTLLMGALWLLNDGLHWTRDVPHLFVYTGAFLTALWLVSVARRRTAAAAGGGPLFGALLEITGRPGIWPVFAFILLYKLGDSAIGFMIKPFWVDRGFSAAQIGVVSVILGIGLSVLGGLIGGILTDRLGIYRALWALGLVQVAPNLGYAACAAWLPRQAQGMAIPLAHQLLIYSVSGLESFCGGLGTAAFLAFLMAIVRKQRAATEYALLSSLFSVSARLAGFVSGFGAHDLGYGEYFFLTFFLAFPAYAFLPAARRMLTQIQQNGDGDGDPAPAR